MSKPIRSRADLLLARAVTGGDTVLHAALQVWQALDERTQRALVCEIVEARTAELRLAYPDTLLIGHGFRTVGAHRTKTGKFRRRELTDEPCVVFTVRAKKKRGDLRSSRVRFLPQYLYAHRPDVIAGRSLLCAVPTDVRVLAEFTAKPRASAVRIECADVRAQKGTIACAVRIPGSPDLYGLSCHHVLAMSKVTRPPGKPAIGAVAIYEDEIQRAFIGRLEPSWIGRLVPGQLSFDAALCVVHEENFDGLKQACGNVRPQRFTDSPSWIPKYCSMSIRGQAISLRFVSEEFGFNRIKYFPSGGPQPIHPRVLEFRVETGFQYPLAGDSGTAITNEDGTELVAMFIASPDNSPAVFAIPSYELVLGSRYGQLGLLTFEKDW